MVSINVIRRFLLLLLFLSALLKISGQYKTIEKCIEAWDIAYYQDTLTGLDSLVFDSNIHLQTSDDDFLKSTLASYMAYAYEEHLRYDSALTYYEIALRYFKSLQDTESMALMYYGLGGCYAELLDYPVSTQQYLEAMFIYDSLGLEEDLADTRNAIAGNFYQLGDGQSALRYFKLALSYYDKTEKSDQVAMIYSNMASIYYQRDQIDSVYHFYQLALSEVIDTEFYGQLIDIYHGIGLTKEQSGNLDEALYYYRRALNLSLQHTEQPEYLGYSYQYIGFYHYAMGNYDSALHYAENVERMTNRYSLQFLRHNNLDLFYRVHRALSNHEKSLAYLEEYYLISDSIYTIQNAKQLKLLEYEYQSKRSQIAALSQNLEEARFQAIQSRNKLYKTILIFGLLFLLVMTFLLVRNSILKSRIADLLKNKEEEIRLKKYRINELESAKSMWFVNLSHELRTPLSLIKGPLQQIDRNSEIDKENGGLIKIALRSVANLEQLINDLMDLAKMESGEIKLNPQVYDLMLYLNTRMQEWTKLVGQKGNILIESGRLNHLMVKLDRKRIGQMIDQMVDNAIRYSHSFVNVKISVELDEGSLQIQIKDEGVGISEKDIPFVFDKFYRSVGAHEVYPAGKGLGLSLSREIVELHGGSISISSTVGKGSTFSVNLPKEVIVNANAEEKSDHENLNNNIIGLAPLILVVEDNPDMQAYINQFIDRRFDVMHAMNPYEALDMMKTRKPNLIISDIMMPKMDGTDFIEGLKRNPETNQIPIVVISALSDEQKRLQLLRLGVSHYFTKPFSPEELSITIENLIRQYEDQHAAHDANAQIQELSHSDRLVKNLEEIVKQHIDDSDFNVNTLADAASLSERQLYRYLRQTVSMTPANFIKEIRLQRAIELARKNVYATTAELSYAVGFQHPSYFTSVFKKRFGKKPSDFMKDQST